MMMTDRGMGGGSGRRRGRFADAMNLDLVAAVLPANGLGRSGQHHPGLVDQHHIGAQVFDRFHSVRGDQQGGARRPPLEDNFLEDLCIHGVESGKRFVKNQQIRFVHQGRHQLYFLLHSLGELLGLFVPPTLDFQAGHPFLGRIKGIPGTHTA